MITEIQKIKRIWTRGSNLAFPDKLCQSVTIDEYEHHQPEHKKLPEDIGITQQTLKTIFAQSNAYKAKTRRYFACTTMLRTFPQIASTPNLLCPQLN